MGYATTRYTFNEVAIHGEKSGKCLCGKRRTRKQRFYQTLNPFNTTKGGRVKSRADIIPELERERAKWMKKPIYCDACEPE